VEALRSGLLPVMAWAVLARGDARLALSYAQEAAALVEREGRPEINEWLLLWIHVEALLGCGERARAAQAARTAIAYAPGLARDAAYPPAAGVRDRLSSDGPFHPPRS
jgi:hypothetical protein